MAERAYSLELRKNVTAKEALKLARTGVLVDKHNFQCCDKKCGVSLTCSNWDSPGKRDFFRVSTNERWHEVGCSEVTLKEEKQFIETETQDAKTVISKNELIKMVKSIPQASHTEKNSDIESESQGEKSRSSSSTSKQVRKEAHNYYSLESFINLNKDKDISKIDKILKINDETLSLNDLFIKSTSRFFPWGKDRIFYGKAKLTRVNDKKDMVQIEFIDSTLPKIYSNIPMLSKRSGTSNITKYLDTGMFPTIFFRGKIITGGKKSDSFNEKIYTDLYFK
ncbi:hypothetical protein [Mycoplasma sp. P36-A1]|uniref:hypothetical protein n=1 Tax=Mycoplasma sp. P36-A1 TaxID=3252900 RepID=UPI003C2D41E7